MNRYAKSYDAIVSTTYFQLAGPQEDPGLEIVSQVEVFKQLDILYKREVIRAVLGDEAHIWLPGGKQVPQSELNPFNDPYLPKSSIGSLARLTSDGKLSLVCIAPLEVEDDTAPHNRHYDQVFSSAHKVLFTYDGDTLSGRLLDGQSFTNPRQLMDPRKWDLSTGKTYQGNEIDDKVFIVSLNTISLDEIIARFPTIEKIEF